MGREGKGRKGRGGRGKGGRGREGTGRRTPPNCTPSSSFLEICPISCCYGLSCVVPIRTNTDYVQRFNLRTERKFYMPN